jgi:hypothetical protein
MADLADLAQQLRENEDNVAVIRSVADALAAADTAGSKSTAKDEKAKDEKAADTAGSKSTAKDEKAASDK